MEFIVKDADPLRVAGVRQVFDSVPLDPSQVSILFDAAHRKVAESGITPGMSIGVYDMEGDKMSVLAGLQTGEARIDGLEVVDLPAGSVASTMHLGSMAGIGRSWQALAQWCDDNGYTFSGPGRELYHELSDDPAQSDWVTELQQPVAKS